MISEPSDAIWGRGNDLTKMLQIGGTEFEITGDYEKVRQIKITQAKSLVPRFQPPPQSHEIGLEIGSGLGIHTSYIASLCNHVHTVDISDHFHELFKRYTADSHNITRHRKDFFPMMEEVPDKSIDFAWSAAVFCHMHNFDIYHYFQELSAKIKPGGGFYVNWQSADTIEYDKDWSTDIAAHFFEKRQFVPIWQTCVQFHSNTFFYRTADYCGFDATHKFSSGSYAEALFVRR